MTNCERCGKTIDVKYEGKIEFNQVEKGKNVIHTTHYFEDCHSNRNLFEKDGVTLKKTPKKLSDQNKLN